jgi:hypothetical protein
MTVVVAVQIISALLTAATNAITAAQKFQGIVETARAEGREITDAELAALKAESDALTRQTLDALPAAPDGSA